jgi:uncharacterized protein (TIGR02996 family)
VNEWRRVWREGFAPELPTGGLTLLLRAIEADDSRLQQGMTTSPPPLMAVQDWPVEGADAIGMTGWEFEETTVGEVEEHFAKACYAADVRLGEPAACRHFLNWYDDTPRDEMLRELAHEVRLVLLFRGSVRECAGGDIPVGFFMAIQANINDAGTIGAAADWLDEHDRPDHAETWRAAYHRLTEVSP